MYVNEKFKKVVSDESFDFEQLNNIKDKKQLKEELENMGITVTEGDINTFKSLANITNVIEFQDELKKLGLYVSGEDAEKIIKKTQKFNHNLDIDHSISNDVLDTVTGGSAGIEAAKAAVAIITILSVVYNSTSLSIRLSNWISSKFKNSKT